jgi:hypothetical protein
LSIRTQWEILLLLFCLNLVVGLCVALSVPGTAYASPVSGGVNATEYEGHFNATEVAKSWSATPFSGIPVIGDIFGGFNFLITTVGYLFDGFPCLLTWISDSYITDVSGQLAFAVITNVLRAVYALLITIFLIEFISGRVFTD